MTTKLSHSVHLSLEEMHGSVKVPHHEAGFWEQWRASVAPAILVSVGYMDPAIEGRTCKAAPGSSTDFCGWLEWPA